MFVVLKLKKAETDILKRVKAVIRGPDITSDRIYYKGDAVYFSVTVPIYKKEIPWQHIQNHCRRLCDRVVLPIGITPPEDSEIRQYSSEHFEKLMLFNTMVEYIKRHGPAPTVSTLCLVDNDGSLCNELSRAVGLFSAINVITQNRQAYESICKSILDNYGLSVSFYPGIPNGENTVVFSPDAEKIPVFFKGTLFCKSSAYLPDCNVIKCARVKLTDKWAQLTPENTDPLTFLSAMYELSGVSELHGTVYEV